jgi:hypothetical protein
VRNQQVYDHFDNVFKFEQQPVDWTTCETIVGMLLYPYIMYLLVIYMVGTWAVVEETSFALSPWHPDNMFHLHNDNLVPMFTNVRSSGSLNKPKVLISPCVSPLHLGFILIYPS